MVFLTFCIILSAVDLLVFDKYATANDFARIKADKMCLDNANTEDRFCETCRSVTLNFLNAYRESNDTNLIRHIAFNFCNKYEFAAAQICSGSIGLNLEIFKYIIDERPELTPEIICGTIFQEKNCGYKISGINDWSVNINAEKPNNLKRCGVCSTSTNEYLNVVHISDIHYDPNYRIGTESNCNAPTCCRYDQPVNKLPNITSIPAQRWGSYKCDTPLKLLEHTLNDIKSKIKNIDYIYVTGDIVHHAYWITSYDEVLDSLTQLNNHLKFVFPNVPIFPIFGNHDQHPMNTFSPETLNVTNPKITTTQRLYKAMAIDWQQFFSKFDSDAYETIRTGGYYTKLLRKGHRLIALNNNGAFSYNWWLLYDSSHLAKQLQWCHDTLLEAERNSECVHILLHIPSNDPNCHPIWAREYWRIIERFHHIVAAQFTGHTHHDQFNLFYSRFNSSRPISVAWNGGSITPHSEVNPNYRVYEIDQCTSEVKDHHTYIFDLVNANLQPMRELEWTHEYSFRHEFGLTNLHLTDLNGFLEKMSINPALLQRYCQFYFKGAQRHVVSNCNEPIFLKNLLAEATNTQHCYNPKGQLLQSSWKKMLESGKNITQINFH